jgi:glycosyltransferase involved in cell wall biosynthesis
MTLSPRRSDPATKPVLTSVDNETAERARHASLVKDAFARGQAALAAGDQPEAVRWLDRAHRLAPADGTIALLLASAVIARDNARAAGLFAEVLASHDVRDAWLGLATARLLSGDLAGARAALGEVLSRHAVWPDGEKLAGEVVRATGAPGWCGLRGDGDLVVHSATSEPVVTIADGRPVKSTQLSRAWPRMNRITVMAGERHLIGSPISARAIGRVEGCVKVLKDGIAGWVWCPADADTDPQVSIGVGSGRHEIVASEPAAGIPGLAPLARPRSFKIPRTSLPAGETTFRLRGRDGRDLRGSPVSIDRVGVGRNKPPPGDLSPSRAAIEAHGASEPPVSARRRFNVGQWRGDATEAVILVTHGDGGGVERRVQASAASHEAQGRRVIVMRPVTRTDGAIRVTVDSGLIPPARFELPGEQSELLRLLRCTKPVAVELHHLLNHDPSMFEIIRALEVPYDVHIHDFAWFCPRIALIGRGNRYCGEPAPAVCEKCVAKLGSFLHEDIRVTALLARSRTILSGARQVIAPSKDAADRMERHFPGISTIVIPHEDDDDLDEPPPISRVDGMVRVCIAGAIGLHKGFHVLLACARDAKKRGLDLTFVVAGTTIDDQRLIDTGRVFVTGPYQPDEAVALIRTQNAAMALLPSIWPETWCLGLTELWRAGLRVAAFDIGAQAERISRTGRGFLLPLGLPPPAINDALLNAARGRSLLPIRPASAYKPSR